eukprot:GCRY01003377.1.p1 GENE.GCRY01003377.1~~GCRY01003377.1.p1  ORF type:complete len:395 (+),score=104.47 GCRY01003377.1:124-1308(+)
MNVRERVKACEEISSQKARLEAVQKLLHLINATVLQTGNVTPLKDTIDYLIRDEVALVFSRSFFRFIAESLPSFSDSLHKELAAYILEKTLPRLVSFENEVSLIRENYADIFEKEERWSEAAKTLAGIPLDSGHRVLDEKYKLKINLRIARLYLEDEDSVLAEAYVTQAALLVPPDMKEEQLLLRSCQARLADYKRKFVDASLKYYHLSNCEEVHFQDQLQALSFAITCAILAVAGPQRSRMLANYYSDERSHALPIFGMLEKMFLERIIRPHEVAAFASTLKPHQMATLSDGSTVLDKAVVTHNVLAATRVYRNIPFSQLALILHTTPEKAERVAASMIAEDRLQGRIDQVHSLIHFGSDEPLQQFDDQVAALCRHINSVSEMIVKDYPQFAV